MITAPSTRNEVNATEFANSSPLDSSSRFSQGSHLAHPKYRPDIDGLRAIAVLLVVGFHAYPTWVRAGFIGVDIFFVISGFLISAIIFGSLERNDFTFAEFYSRRVRRIFPALLVILTFAFVLGWFTLLPDEYRQLGKHIAGGAGFVSNLVFWRESGYFDTAAEAKPLLHLWSLGVEEQFYIVYPLLLWLAWKRRWNLAIVTVAITLLSFGVNLGKFRSDAVADFYSPLTRFWELMTGSLLAYVKLSSVPKLHSAPSKVTDRSKMGLAKDTNLRHARSGLGMILIVIGVAFITGSSRFPGWWALFPTIGSGLIISAGPEAWVNRLILSNRILVWFGLISYPLYLWHWVVLFFVRILEVEVRNEVRIVAVLVSIAFAWLTYRFVERPLRFGKHSPLKTASLCLAIFLVGCAGYGTYALNGLPFRFPKIIQELTQFKYDYKQEYREGSCFLDPEQDFTTFKSCNTAVDAGRQTLVLWGDSHAAHLYPGYRQNFSARFNIVQRTASLCPPIIGMEISDRPHCKKINDYVLSEISRSRPAKVILAADWEAYDWRKIDATIMRLKRLGVVSIDVVGPVPQWNDTLPRQLYLYFRSDPLHRIPYRMKNGLKQEPFQTDSAMRTFFYQKEVEYISPVSILCNEAGCITRFGERGESLSAFDYGHLTSTASGNLVSKFPPI